MILGPVEDPPDRNAIIPHFQRLLVRRCKYAQFMAPITVQIDGSLTEVISHIRTSLAHFHLIPRVQGKGNSHGRACAGSGREGVTGTPRR